MSIDNNGTSKIEQYDCSPRLYLVICNIQKIANVKAMMMAAVAFGCSQVLLVGQEKNSQRKDMFPAPFQEAVQKGLIRLQRFGKWKECVSYMETQSVFLIGVEIDENSRLLDDGYFAKNFPSATGNDGKAIHIGILMGNEGQGIQPAHLRNCNALIRIPQYGVGTASMNVNVATNIVLYRFQNWRRTILRRNHDAEHLVGQE